MHEIYELKELLMKELEEYGRKRDLSTGSLEVVDKLAHTIKNLCKIIEAAEEEEGYSERGGSYASYARGGQGGGRGGNRGGGSNRGGSNRGSYEGGNMGGNMGGMSGEGSYARGGGGRGRNARRDSMGRYSSEQGYSRDAEEMAEQLRELMEDAPDEMIRRDIEKLLRKVEQM